MSTTRPNYKDLEVVPNQYPEKNYTVNVLISEFNCVCPRTGQPDFATIEINYIPDKYIVELKSLKLYVQKYRNKGIFHETVTNKILEDFRQACKPKRVEAVGRFNPRGGISTIVRASWPE